MVPGEGEGPLAVPGAFLIGSRRFLLSPAAGFGGAMDLLWFSPPPGLIQSTVLLVPSTAGLAQPQLGLADLKAYNQQTSLEPTSDANTREVLGELPGQTAAITALGLGHKNVPFSHTKSQPSKRHPLLLCPPPRNCLIKMKLFP